VNAVVVDTSVWIDFFGGRATERLDAALRLGTVVLPPIVAAEILSGIRPSDRPAMIAFLGDLELAETTFSHWIAVGELRSAMSARGIAVSTPDAHVAQCALDRDALLLSHDAVFGRIAKTTPLRLARG
jgi:predicted nucleic acid-binding protein